MAANWQRIASMADVLDGWGVTFPLPREPGETGVLIRWRGELKAYRNICPHQAYPLDFPAGTGQVFTDDRTQLECPVHTAYFEPDTGQCTQGPCKGQALESLPIEIVGEDIFIVVKEVHDTLQ